jgi:ribosome biogenesis protein MAK21
MLTRKEVNVANKLIDIYFAMFRKLLGINAKDKVDKSKKDEKERLPEKKKKDKGGNKDSSKNREGLHLEEESLNSKMLAAVLTGVNRAFPFSKIDDKV